MRSSPERSKGAAGSGRGPLGLGGWGWALLALGLAIRVGYGAYALRAGLSDPGSDYYEAIALNLVEHRGYAGLPGDTRPTAAREPVFVLLIALVYFVVGHHPLALVAAQSALNVGACWLLALLAEKLSGRRAGRIALWLGLFYPYFVFYCAYFYRETVLTAVVCAALYCSGEALGAPRDIKKAAAAGLLWGLAAVTMSTFLLVSAIVGAAMMLVLLRTRALAPAAAMALALAAPPSAWLLRNQAVFHRFIPGSTLGGYNLYTTLIVPEEDRGTERETYIEQHNELWMRLNNMSSLMTDDGSQQEAFLAAAKDYLRAHRGAYLAHMGHQAAKLWRFYPYERKYQHSYRLIKALSLLSDGWLIPLGLWGLWLARRRRGEPWLGLLLMGAGTLAYALIAAIIRYRLPLMPPLLVGASLVLSEKIGPALGIAKEPEIGFH